MNHSGPYFIQIFIPSIGKSINLMKYQIYPDIIGSGSIIYTTGDCTGPGFLINMPGTYPDHVTYRNDIDKIYIMMPPEWITMNSYYDFGSDECLAGTNAYFATPIAEIAPEELTFTLPLAPPLMYEYGSR